LIVNADDFGMCHAMNEANLAPRPVPQTTVRRAAQGLLHAAAGQRYPPLDRSDEMLLRQGVPLDAEILRRPLSFSPHERRHAGWTLEWAVHEFATIAWISREAIRAFVTAFVDGTFGAIPRAGCLRLGERVPYP